MLKLRNSIKGIINQKNCGSFDANCIFCDGQKWDFNLSNS